MPHPLLRIFLIPLSLLYGLAIFVRDKLYEHRYLKSVEFDFPVISVGNISYGGTGKTPQVEYLIRLLSQNFNIAVLSRGYLRKSSGYLPVEVNTPAREAGDEPSMIKKKYPHVAVAVCEERAIGVPQLLSMNPQTDVVLLDDAFQHRAVRAGLNIVLTGYDHPFTRDYILPLGTLREFRSAYQRAQFIIVTKCPPGLSQAEREKLKKEINPAPGQLVFFSYLQYDAPYLLTDFSVRLAFEKTQDVFLVCGIANPQSIKQQVRPLVKNLYALEFPDHHHFGRADMEKITEAFGNIETENKLMLTTEKDAVRLLPFRQWIIEKNLPIFVLPVKTDFFETDKNLFDSEITGWLHQLKTFRNQG